MIELSMSITAFWERRQSHGNTGSHESVRSCTGKSTNLILNLRRVFLRKMGVRFEERDERTPGNPRSSTLLQRTISFQSA